jgi:hypothetical protein
MISPELRRTKKGGVVPEFGPIVICRYNEQGQDWHKTHIQACVWHHDKNDRGCDNCPSWKLFLSYRRMIGKPIKDDRWQRNHPQFQKSLISSDQAKLFAARWLEWQGKEVRVGKTRIAPSKREWARFRDKGDLVVTEGAETYTVEVKKLRPAFQVPADWRLTDNGGRRATIICAKHSWDIASPKPRYYLLFNADLTACMRVSAADSESWYIEYREDRRYERYGQNFYWTLIERVEFLRVDPEFLKLQRRPHANRRNSKGDG